MDYLQQRVEMPIAGTVRFELPGEDEMLAEGLHPEAVRKLLAAQWLEEMVADVRETPEYCEPDDSPEQVLGYARDVVVEYLRKRFEL